MICLCGLPYFIENSYTNQVIHMRNMNETMRTTQLYCVKWKRTVVNIECGLAVYCLELPALWHTADSEATNGRQTAAACSYKKKGSSSPEMLSNENKGTPRNISLRNTATEVTDLMSNFWKKKKI